MFGALNRFIGRLDGEPHGQGGNQQGVAGFQVLRNTNTNILLEPWFDFIIGINGRTLDNNDPNLFSTEIRNCAGSTVSIGVWSAKGQRIREIYVPVPQENPTLGLSLQWMPIDSADDVWHILDVTPNSPADLAGLLPYGDYVIGSPEGMLRGESGLGELVEDYIDRPLALLVYNHEYNITRLVDIKPSRSWGGQGALGCTLGFGALHRVPAPLEEPPNAPGETMFDTSLNEKSPLASTGTAPEFLIPANMDFQNPSPPPGTGPPKRDRKVRAHAHISPSLEIDEYFREGEEKSREQDHAHTPKATSGIPPPPKVGPPPKAATTGEGSKVASEE